ncbi:MAG: hypothetical protein FWE20_07265 [Defluviitaleaceae bacterium]|nr:hypothetical protein [Defluviitaleaceae bacterium]
MKYDTKTIKTRIREERIKLGTQESVACKLSDCDTKGTDVQTIKTWENDQNGRIPSLPKMLLLCEVFKCDLAYLLGEIDTKTRQETDILQTLGLTPKAQSNIKKAIYPDKVIGDEKFIDLEKALWAYVSFESTAKQMGKDGLKVWKKFIYDNSFDILAKSPYPSLEFLANPDLVRAALLNEIALHAQNLAKSIEDKGRELPDGVVDSFTLALLSTPEDEVP